MFEVKRGKKIRETDTDTVRDREKKRNRERKKQNTKLRTHTRSEIQRKKKLLESSFRHFYSRAATRTLACNSTIKPHALGYSMYSMRHDLRDLPREYLILWIS